MEFVEKMGFAVKHGFARNQRYMGIGRM